MDFACIYIQDGCTFRDHVITPSSTHNSLTDTEATPSQQQVYSVLCQLRDTICAETLKILATNVNNGDASPTSSTLKNDSISVSQQQAALNELWFLQNEAREPRLPPSSSGEVPISQCSHRDVSRTRSNESVQHSSSTSHGINTQVRHSHGQRSVGGAIARQGSRDSLQQSHDLAEMEEDDERERPQVLVQPPRPRRGRHVRI